MARQQQQQQNNCFQLLRMLEFAKIDFQHWKICHMAMFSMALMALLSVECRHHVCPSQLWFVARALLSEQHHLWGVTIFICAHIHQIGGMAKCMWVSSRPVARAPHLKYYTSIFVLCAAHEVRLHHILRYPWFSDKYFYLSLYKSYSISIFGDPSILVALGTN